jgi:hypothetical protein
VTKVSASGDPADVAMPEVHCVASLLKRLAAGPAPGDANDRLWSGLARDAPGLSYDLAAPAGHSQIAKLIQAGPASQTTLLGALQATHWTIQGAFCAYQSACEERRQLAAEVGKTIRQFLDALLATGWSEDQAQNANVHELASAIGDAETKR